jgi:alkyl sulfatase BDS1-like metallo-beta-lactamase superfamily hydrolase
LFDVVGSRFNGAKIDKSLTINVKAIDTGEVATVILKNNALSNRPNVLSDQPDIVLSASRKDIVDLFSRNTKLNDRFTISGNQSDLQSILDLIETPDYYFNIIEP